MDVRRNGKLYWFFRQVLDGQDNVLTNPKAKRFLEAMCAKDDPVGCIESIISSKNGISAWQQAIRIETTASFINTSIVSVINYLQSPELISACGGDLLHLMLQRMVDPPVFWNCFSSHVQLQTLDTAALQSFTWMLLQLLSIPQLDATSFIHIAADPKVRMTLERAEAAETRNLFQKIQRVILSLTLPTGAALDGPGGRHDNDFADFRKIAIMPSTDELVTTDSAFLRFATEIEEIAAPERLGVHLDNQFRLLREDMLRELKEELGGQNKRKKQRIDGLRLSGATCCGGNQWAVEFLCLKGLSFMPKKMKQPERQDFLKKHKKILAHGSLTCLCVDGRPSGLGTVSRREDRLAEEIPVITLHLQDNEIMLRRTLRDIRTGTQIQVLLLNTAVFAYEPILRQLQNVRDLPLAESIMAWNPSQEVRTAQISSSLKDLTHRLDQDSSAQLQDILSLKKSVKLDRSQADAFCSSLTQQVTLIQGPPGTGKSFIGALVAKALYCSTQSKILVLSYTNHALDQYLEDLVEIGIPQSDIVRLGSPTKASSATRPLVMAEQLRAKGCYKLSRDEWALVNKYKVAAQDAGTKLTAAFRDFAESRPTRQDIMDYLEFSDDYQDYFEAFQLDHDDAFSIVDARGKAAHKFYLLDCWMRNEMPKVIPKHADDHTNVWSTSKEQRSTLKKVWLNHISEEHLDQVVNYGRQYDTLQTALHRTKAEAGRRLIEDMRIIGCTTTAAAKQVKDIQSAQPDIVIVEEAGEILESHVLAALGPETKQLILIGDHKQLRPKANYDLSVEKGTGYDLNRSLFERLVLKGYPHQRLSQQHRMRTEISAFVRTLTYPDLTDADSTKSRSDIRGIQDNVVFVAHDVLEDEGPPIYDPRDGGSSASKKNVFEAHMVFKCVKYLAQQGYRSDQIVVLTPYLGQLRLLYDEIQKENDPVLNDLDSYDLVRAGLMPAATAKAKRSQLRVSTIDNYQGEESDIVVVSLTRSNPRGDIGFMSAPERLNVLISRARDGIVLFGNVETFLNARKGKDVWSKFICMLREGHHIYEGLPVLCETHQKKQAILTKPEDFDTFCPDGGCDAPCGVVLNCSTHSCPSKCHQLYDHSKMKCTSALTDMCSVGHKLSWQCCDQRPVVCQTCQSIKQREEKKKRKELERIRAETLAKQEHDAKMADLDTQIETELQRVKDISLQEDRRRIHEQRMSDLRQAKEAIKHVQQHTNSTRPLSSTFSPKDSSNKPEDQKAPTSTAVGETPSPCKMTNEISHASKSWNDMKALEGLRNAALDQLMQMTGLESVKTRFLDILQRIRTAQRQSIDIKQERLGTMLLGNPGTGKTTVARIYAKFLAEIDAIPTAKFYETSGAKLANEGVQGAKKMITETLEAGGGAIFLDEAYQLVSGNSYGGGAVLDYLLSEIENNTGKIVFIFAGYENQMEKFCQHNPGLTSRIPHSFKFADYSESELRHMLEHMINKKFRGRMLIEDGPSGLYMRIVVRRLHRMSGQEGFGNARALENVLNKVVLMQSRRLAIERGAGKKPNDFFFSKHDLIGPEPSEALKNSAAWIKLQKMVGLDSVKTSIQALLEMLATNYKRELKESPPIEVSLNRLFLGPPGTGKTTVARLYGQILADIGLLSTSECVMKVPSDFIGSVLGESERNTKAILENTKGKVLVLDEAYMLNSSFNNNTSDPYRTAVIDTIVSQVHNNPGDDRAVILLGYEDQMKEMLRKVNPGLSRRFPVENAFVFADYNDVQLRLILDHKLGEQGLCATNEGKDTAIGVLAKLRRRPNFGNAGEVENMLSRAKECYARRQKTLEEQSSGDIVFQTQDFDPEFGRSSNALQNCEALFRDEIGHGDVMEKLTGYVQSFQNAQKLELDPAEMIPFNFVFKGPPGTGKTTTARKIGTVFCDMGFLGSDNVIECSATDLVGQYVGHTGPKVIAKFDEALGQVLFIDEAYRLGEGPFAKEAIDELVDCLTKERYKSRMLVILAGYEDEINSLLRVNPGLSSRFPEEIMFQALTPHFSISLLLKKLEKQNKLRLNLDSAGQDRATAEEVILQLSQLSGWGNGRDIETLASRIVASALRTAELEDGKLNVGWPDVHTQLIRLHQERSNRDTRQSPRRSSDYSRQIKMQMDDTHPNTAEQNLDPIATATPTSMTADINPAETVQDPEVIEEHDGAFQPVRTRDNGVSDAIWQQLNNDRKVYEKEEKELKTAIREATEKREAIEQDARKAAADTEVLAKQAAINNEFRRQHEVMRLKALEAKRKADEEASRLEDLMQKQRQEQVIQQKLRVVGNCPVGYRWIKQSDGYRCAGGSHWVPNGALGL